MKRNVIVGQAGGPCAVFNAILAGVFHMADDSQTTVLGMMNGLQGLLQERIVNLSDTIRTQYDLEVLRTTPSAYLGSCRYMLPDAEKDHSSYDRIFDILRKNNISCFYYIGGREALVSIDQLSTYGRMIGCDDIKIIGIPKTIDNNIKMTDHAPGFGSAAKYVATSVKELIRDNMVNNTDIVTVVEIMGRETGWLTAASTLCKGDDCPGPDFIYLPEVPMDPDEAIAQIKEVKERKHSVLVCIGEGVRLKDGKYLCDEAMDYPMTDIFGRKMLTGSARALAKRIHEQLGCRTRAVEFSALQRSASHMSSKTDNDEAFMIGENAVKASNDRHTSEMIYFTRESNSPYMVSTHLCDVRDITTDPMTVPLSWVKKDNTGMTKKFEEYARPLIMGEIQVHYENGLPVHVPYINI
ncbi:MAG: diphosphate--fructose-6-phosphate 1-phosphotransferase [Oscillospiraceae bacterium]|jgi:6-phosphofructokinase